MIDPGGFRTKVSQWTSGSGVLPITPPVLWKIFGGGKVIVGELEVEIGFGVRVARVALAAC